MSLCLREETKISRTWVYFCWVCAAGLSEPLPPLQSILWPIVYPIVTFGQICNFCDPSLVTFYFYELTHSFRLNEKQFTFTRSTNILVRLLIVRVNGRKNSYSTIASLNEPTEALKMRKKREAPKQSLFTLHKFGTLPYSQHLFII